MFNATSTTTCNNSTSVGSNNVGGGIFNNTGGTLNVTNSTLSGNSVSGGGSNNGGGINNTGGTVNARNTIVAGNTASTAGPDVFGTFTSQGHNFIGKNDGSSGFTDGNNGDQVGTVASPKDPKLGTLANNGGPTQTYLLLPGSPAINAGDNCVFDNSCSPSLAAALTTDQRGTGFSRKVGGTVDIGAVEVNYAISATAGTPQSTAPNTAFPTQLQATVTESGNPISGITVTFTAPASGPSGTFPGNVTTANAMTNGSGVATAPVFTANGTAGGPYNVVASFGIGLPTTNFSLTNIKANQTITFGALAPRTFGNPDFPVSAAASSGLPVSFSASGQCTVTSPSPGTVHITGAGSCTITASQAGNSTYNPAPDVPQSFSIAKANQTITFGPIANKTFGDPDFLVNPTASSGLPVSLMASGQCTVTTPSPGTVHITGGGSCTITASQGGDSNYNPAPNVPQTFSIAKANQTITFGAISNKTFGDPDFVVSATASSGLPVSFSASGNCTVTIPSPGTVHLACAVSS